MNDHIVLVDGARTPIGRFAAPSKTSTRTSSERSRSARRWSAAACTRKEVDEVVMGQVGQVGQVGPDAYNTRRYALGAAISARAAAMNANRLPASGLQAIVVGAQQLLGKADVVVAGGTESMTRQP